MRTGGSCLDGTSGGRERLAQRFDHRPARRPRHLAVRPRREAGDDEQHIAAREQVLALVGLVKTGHVTQVIGPRAPTLNGDAMGHKTVDLRPMSAWPPALIRMWTGDRFGVESLEPDRDEPATRNRARLLRIGDGDRQGLDRDSRLLRPGGSARPGHSSERCRRPRRTTRRACCRAGAGYPRGSTGSIASRSGAYGEGVGRGFCRRDRPAAGGRPRDLGSDGSGGRRDSGRSPQPFELVRVERGR